jgi:CheY-like chemotaxis protein
VSKRRLLLADDSVTIQKVVNLTFADEGIEVITAGDGNAAIEKLRETEPNLVMADVNMPGLNGYEICERIKSDEATRHTPVILLVGSFEPFDEARARAVGADDYLTKPFQSIRQLVNKVTELLSAATGEAREEISPDTLEMDKPEMTESSRFEDSAADDDMIETRQMENYSSFEAPAFGSREASFSQTAQASSAAADNFAEAEFEAPVERDDYREAEEEIERTEKRYFQGFEQPYSETYAESVQREEEDFSARTAAMDEPEIENMTPVADDDYFSPEAVPQPVEEAGRYFEESEKEMTNYHEEEKQETIGEIPQPSFASALELDEFDLLDLPPMDFEESEEFSAGEIETAPPAEQPAAKGENEPETVENDEKPQVAAQFSHIDFPPEVIEAIADKVVEKLSRKLKE